MNDRPCIDSLAHFPVTLQSIVAGVHEPALRRRGLAGQWSIIEILCHLADEEIEDFRPRLELTLSAPEQPWPGIDPQGAAAARQYHEQNPHAVLKRFTAARQENVHWLRTLEAPDWSAAHVHPKLGSMRAGDLLASWAAHDLLHLRQIAKRLFEWLQADAAPCSTTYAGEWTF